MWNHDTPHYLPEQVDEPLHGALVECSTESVFAHLCRMRSAARLPPLPNDTKELICICIRPEDVMEFRWLAGNIPDRRRSRQDHLEICPGVDYSKVRIPRLTRH